MAKAKKKGAPVRSVSFMYKKHHVQVLLDKVLIFRLIRNLHGRFWGMTGIIVMLTGFTICFLIRPDLIHISTAFSDFGNDIRTAPYFAGSVFFAAYGMWRWRNYLYRTWRRTMPVTGLVTLTVLGLYLVALMPVSWRPIPYYVHMFGIILAGASMLATVILDSLLTKTKNGKNANLWRLTRFVAFALIISGGLLTLGSAHPFNWYRVSLLGESLLITGYFVWIALKTFQGEGNRTVLARILKKVVFID
jgi:hypothetical protein